MMRFIDLLAMSVLNLMRRKMRTALTVLGVVIGTASIVVMVSLGIGLNELQVEQIASYGSLTAINVYSDSRWSGDQDSKSEPNHMTDDVIEQLRQLDYVTTVSPVLSVDTIMRQGLYECHVTLVGATREYMSQIPLGEGALPDPNNKELQLIVGNAIIQWFSNYKTGEGYWDSGELPEVDFMNQPMFVIFDIDAYYQAKQGGSSDQPVTPPKKYMIDTAALVAGGIDDYNNYAYSMYTDIDLLKDQLKKVFKKNPIPGQPTTKKGKPYKYFIYNEAIVSVDDMSHVTEVQKIIQEMGYQAHSNVEGMEQTQKQSAMIQAALGGIGAVSLFVAAIGIANTMMMSIYERTKEIGVIKVLGCDMNVIRNMFLIESGFIGFFGGVIGVGMSYGISYLINRFLDMGEMMMMIEGDISRIPLWLTLSAIGFAVFVGMAAGFFPSLRAMKLSPLAAIRNN